MRLQSDSGVLTGNLGRHHRPLSQSLLASSAFTALQAISCRYETEPNNPPHNTTAPNNQPPDHPQWSSTQKNDPMAAPKPMTDAVSVTTAHTWPGGLHNQPLKAPGPRTKHRIYRLPSSAARPRRCGHPWAPNRRRARTAIPVAPSLNPTQVGKNSLYSSFDPHPGGPRDPTESVQSARNALHPAPNDLPPQRIRDHLRWPPGQHNPDLVTPSSQLGYRHRPRLLTNPPRQHIPQLATAYNARLITDNRMEIAHTDHYPHPLRH